MTEPINIPASSNLPSPAEGSSSGGQDCSDEQLQLVSFGVGDEEFAVNILNVQEINRMMTITRVPQSPPSVEGVINLRGRIIPVVDLRKRFNIRRVKQASSSRIIVVEVDGRVLGFVVDCVHEVLRISRSIVDPTPGIVTHIDSSYIMGIGKLEDRLLILLDLAKLFSVEELAKLESAASSPPDTEAATETPAEPQAA